LIHFQLLFLIIDQLLLVFTLIFQNLEIFTLLLLILNYMSQLFYPFIFLFQLQDHLLRLVLEVFKTEFISILLGILWTYFVFGWFILPDLFDRFAMLDVFRLWIFFILETKNHFVIGNNINILLQLIFSDL